MPVIPILFAIWVMSSRVRRTIIMALREPETRGLIYGTLLILAGGTLFYRLVEGWSWIDALYFSVVTLTTVGFGDLSPKTDAGKLFTIFYILAGLGIIASFIGLMADQEGFWRRTKSTEEAASTDEDPSSSRNEGESRS